MAFSDRVEHPQGTFPEDFDVTLVAAGNTNPFGVWSDGTTMWVGNIKQPTSSKIFAYNLSTKAHTPAKTLTP